MASQAVSLDALKAMALALSRKSCSLRPGSTPSCWSLHSCFCLGFVLSTLLGTALALSLVPSRVLGLFSLALALVLSQAQDRAEDFTERVKCEADEFNNVLAF